MPNREHAIVADYLKDSGGVGLCSGRTFLDHDTTSSKRDFFAYMSKRNSGAGYGVLD